ncbi:MAG TPA: preprotein translocase subunit SecG [Lacipirellulaceae bacterium]|jgi:preprotein translocase subunit SecG
MSALFEIVLSILATFLILLILVQRGRGGGLTGALGGMGGSSAFGAKAGDVFTRVTIGTATIWIGVCVAAAYWSNPTHHSDRLGSLSGSVPASSSPADGKSAAETGGATGAGTGESSKPSTLSGEAAPPAGQTAPATNTAPPTQTPETEGK